MKITTREVVFGLLILVALVALRVFWPTVKAEKIPSPTVKVTAIDSTACIAPTEYMRSHHMQLLNEWRNTGARDNRPYVNAAGKKFQKNIQLNLWPRSLWTRLNQTHSNPVRISMKMNSANWLVLSGNRIKQSFRRVW